MNQVNYFDVLGLEENVDDREQIDASYRERKRLWDGRRHNPAFRHEYLLVQERMAQAVAVLSDPRKRRAHRALLGGERRAEERAVTAEFVAWVRLACDSGYLSREAREKLVDRGVARGMVRSRAETTVRRVLLSRGVREGRPPEIEDRVERRETFEWFVSRGLGSAGPRGSLDPEVEVKLQALARQFGLGEWRLAEAIERSSRSRWSVRWADLGRRFLALVRSPGRVAEIVSRDEHDAQPA